MGLEFVLFFMFRLTKIVVFESIDFIFVFTTLHQQEYLDFIEFVLF
jgi:hypothetical protein